MITELVMMAMIMVESGGDDLAVGDKGKSIGCLQIRAGVIKDVNRAYKTTYKWPESCYSRKESKEICRLYLTHYTPRGASDERLARIWNGGPKGYTKKATEKYWGKVKVWHGVYMSALAQRGK